MLINDTNPDNAKFVHPYKPPIRYAGAKSRLFKKYDTNGFFPEHKPSVFVDMFGGSTSMSLWVREKWPDVPIVVNDNCSEMMQMFRVIADHLPQMEPFNETYRVMYRDAHTFENRKKLYYDLRLRYLKRDFTSEIEESALLLFLMRTNFNGFFGHGLKDYPGRYSGTAGIMNLNPDGELFSVERLRKFSKYLQTFVLSIGDFEMGTTHWIQENAWFYADPPYRLSTTEYHEKGSSGDDVQLRLIKYMHELDSKGVKVAMSNREHYDLGDLKWRLTSFGKDHLSGLWFGQYFDSNWNSTLFKHKYTSGHHNKGDGVKTTEILIKNY